MINVLFVCLGNICRSPMAEGHFKKLVHERGLSNKIFCDSAGTGSYHIGALPDERMRKTALNYEIELTHRARELKSDDFKKFDYIIAMDSSNHRNISILAEKSDIGSCKVIKMRSFDVVKDSEDVPDPYYGGIDGFTDVYNIIKRSNEAFIDYLITEHKIE